MAYHLYVHNLILNVGLRQHSVSRNNRYGLTGGVSVWLRKSGQPQGLPLHCDFAAVVGAPSVGDLEQNKTLPLFLRRLGGGQEVRVGKIREAVREELAHIQNDLG